jgi:hypothetical protein
MRFYPRMHYIGETVGLFCVRWWLNGDMSRWGWLHRGALFSIPLWYLPNTRYLNPNDFGYLNGPCALVLRGGIGSTWRMWFCHVVKCPVKPQQWSTI